MAMWKSSLVQTNHRLLVFINLPAVVLPSISQPSAGNLLELRDPVLIYKFYYQLDPGLQLRP